MDKENKLILYKDEEGRVSVNTRFADEDVWLTQAQLVEIYQSSKSNISEHLTNIFADKELEQGAVVRNFRTTAADGKNYQVLHYNLDVIIALGYRVQSPIAVRFRRWATQRLHEYIQKGFTMDDERLKQGGNRYFKELLQRICDIRSSERNFYQQVTDIYATSTDYDPRAEMTKLFFATVQNKMHYAVHEHTAAELIYERVDNEKPFVGMTNFKGNYVTRDDVKIACYIAIGYGETQGVGHKIKTVEQVSNASDITPSWFKKGVEAALLAPTAVNQQKFSFEYVGMSNNRHQVRAKKGFSMIGYTQMDLGIAKYHFEVGAGKVNFEWV